MGKHIVHCRVCKEEIDINHETNWIQPSKRWYYHKECYHNWKNSNPSTDEEWVALIYDYLARDLKVKYDYFLCEAQRKKFIKNHNCTSKGIFFALKYFYEVKGNSWDKGHGGIGIVPYVYRDSCLYWSNQERRSRGACDRIVQQTRQNIEKEKRTVKKQRKRKNNKALNMLESIE